MNIPQVVLDRICLYWTPVPIDFRPRVTPILPYPKERGYYWAKAGRLGYDDDRWRLMWVDPPFGGGPANYAPLKHFIKVEVPKP